jgi:L-lactate dehydrogenase complex protein LldG
VARAKGCVVSDAREDILTRIAHNRTRMERPRYGVPTPMVNDLASLFEIKADNEGAQITPIGSPNRAPGAIASALAAADLPMRLHLPKDSELRGLPWDLVPHLALSETPPGPESAALSAADYGIAETGTLVFLSDRGRPSSWHFLPEREFVLLSRSQVVATLEDVLALVAPKGMPSTMNLVTGPSCTGDIEQAMEVGAHGPKQLRILMCD